MTVRWVEGAVNECLEFVQQKCGSTSASLVQSARRFGAEFSAGRGGYTEDPRFISQHHTSLEEDGALPGHFRVFRGTKSGISTCQESEIEWEILCGQS